MRRRTRPVPLARMDLNKLIRTLRQRSISDWPQHLSSAFAVLTAERNLDPLASREMIILATSAAHTCALDIDLRALGRSREVARAKAEKALRHLAKCAARSPASLRHSLDRSVRSVLSRGAVDAVVLQRVVHRAAHVFRKFRKIPAAATALNAAGFPDARGQGRIGLISNLEALRPTARGRAEQALANLCCESHPNWTGSRVFEVLATAVSGHSEDVVSPEISDLLVQYVGQVGEGWKALGLRPGRASRDGDTTYRSRFHRFCDLVLMAFVDPGSLRHHGDLTEIRQKLHRSHLALPAAWRARVDAGLRVSDRVWLISEDHLRRARVRKSPRRTPLSDSRKI
jgi:hypothetical protein